MHFMFCFSSGPTTVSRREVQTLEELSRGYACMYICITQYDVLTGTSSFFACYLFIGVGSVFSVIPVYSDLLVLTE